MGIFREDSMLSHFFAWLFKPFSLTRLLATRSVLL